jgi:polysaccharide pyruvyl transferase WcaK-like protein
MRVIVATGLNEGEAEYKNMGDVAMLQAAISRMRCLWPDAAIEVLTDSSVNLARYCPGARPLPRAGCACLVENRILPGRYRRLLPKWAAIRLGALERAIGRGWPSILEFLIHRRLAFRGRNRQRNDFDLFLDALHNADLLVVCGSGGFADSCQKWNLSVLGTIEAAIRRGIPVVMFGQGMGPLSDPVVLSRAKEVLPHVGLITLRGSRGGLALLESVGVHSAKVMTTGDEAIETAYAARAQQLGGGIGINLRVASYSGVQEYLIGEVSSTLQEFARRHRAPLIPIPIAFHESANDHLTIRRLLKDFDDESDSDPLLDSPRMLIKQASRCRIVVTGAYHAAVFALAQGISVVCLHNSDYYLAKFQGLVDLFGAGCVIIALAEPDLPARLAAAMESSWSSAETVRASLLCSALVQVENSLAAYHKIENMIASDETRLMLSVGVSLP